TGAQHGRGFLGGVLEILRVVVAAVHDHQVLDASGDVELAVDVHAVIAGAQPDAVGRNALGVAALGLATGELIAGGVLGLLGATPVADADVVAVQPDLADLAVGHLTGALRGVQGLGVDDGGPLRQRHITAGDLRDGVLGALLDLHHATGIELVTVDVDDL